MSKSCAGFCAWFRLRVSSPGFAAESFFTRNSIPFLAKMPTSHQYQLTKMAKESETEIEATPMQNEARFSDKFWPQLKRVIVFQLKLYVDAIRDVLLSLLTLIAFVLDVLMQRHGKDSFFEQVLLLGRRTEKAINLFNQYDHSERGSVSIDGIIDDVEKKLRD